ncbi:MAG: hypothetical protein ACFCUU_18230 [Cyclobacteriaceae bacterium]
MDFNRVKNKAVIILIFLGTASLLFISLRNNEHDEELDLLSINEVDRMHVDELYKSYVENRSEANENFSDKVLDIRGTLVSVAGTKSGASSLLIGGESAIIYCQLEKSKSDKIKDYSVGDEIIIRGLCIGFDESNDEILFTHCIILDFEEGS